VPRFGAAAIQNHEEPQALSEHAAEPRRGSTWVQRTTVAGLAASLSVHVIVALVAAAIVFNFPGGGGGEGDDAVEFAVMTSAELDAMPAESVALTAPAAPDVADALEPVVDPLDASGAASLDPLADQPLEVEIDPGGGALAGGSIQSLGGAGGGATSFFGIEAQGHRFAYIVDVSASMRDGGRMQRTLAELIGSVGALQTTAEFVALFYNSAPHPAWRPLRWREASESNKDDFASRLSTIEPDGGTRPLPAFQLLYRMRVKPDAIYFMTDGRIPGETPGGVASLNARHDVPIHCILVGDVSGNAATRDEVIGMLERIANRSGGRFRHVQD